MHQSQLRLLKIKTVFSYCKLSCSKVMAFIQVVRRVQTLAGAVRHFSNTKNLEVTVNDKNGLTTVTLTRPPVNNLNLELLTDFSRVLSDLKEKKSAGMILTSYSNRVFSGGLDIAEFCNQGTIRQLWMMLQEVWWQLYASPFPTAAAITGHACGSGCLLSLACEYRVMVKNSKIGLNETKVGFFHPTWFIKSMQNTISRRNTEAALLGGLLFNTDEAFKIGLVDEVADDKEDALEKAEAFFQRSDKIPPVARVSTKKNLRGADVEELKMNREKDLEKTLSYVLQPEVQNILELIMNKTKK